MAVAPAAMCGDIVRDRLEGREALPAARCLGPMIFITIYLSTYLYIYITYICVQREGETDIERERDSMAVSSVVLI